MDKAEHGVIIRDSHCGTVLETVDKGEIGQKLLEQLLGLRLP